MPKAHFCNEYRVNSIQDDETMDSRLQKGKYFFDQGISMCLAGLNDGVLVI